MMKRSILGLFLLLAVAACATAGLTSYWRDCPPCPDATACNRMSGRCEAQTGVETHYGDEGSDVP